MEEESRGRAEDAAGTQAGKMVSVKI